MKEAVHGFRCLSWLYDNPKICRDYGAPANNYRKEYERIYKRCKEVNMALENFVQPDVILIEENLRLRKYDGHYETFLSGYQDPVVYQNSEGIFDESRIPDLDYMNRMCSYLSRVGELYYIEVSENGDFIPVGDVTVKPENPPIAIWKEQYRCVGIGRKVMGTVIDRLRALGYSKITGSTVYKWNVASQRLHASLGFVLAGEDDQEYTYELTLA